MTNHSGFIELDALSHKACKGRWRGEGLGPALSFIAQGAGLIAQAQGELVEGLSPHHRHPSDSLWCRICEWLLPGYHNQQALLWSWEINLRQYPWRAWGHPAEIWVCWHPWWPAGRSAPAKIKNSELQRSCLSYVATVWRRSTFTSSIVGFSLLRLPAVEMTVFTALIPKS